MNDFRRPYFANRYHEDVSFAGSIRFACRDCELGAISDRVLHDRDAHGGIAVRPHWSAVVDQLHEICLILFGDDHVRT